MGRSVRRWAVVGTAVMLSIGGTVASPGVAGAAKPVITATGNVVCNGPGKVKVNPPLTDTPAAGTRTLTVKAKLACSGGTGNPAVVLSTGKFVSVTTIPGSVTCATFVGDHTNTTVSDVKWKAVGGKVNPTHIVNTTYNGQTTGFSFPAWVGSPIPAPLSNPTVTGSYQLPPHAMLGGFSTPSASILPANPACAGKGVKKLIVTGGFTLF
jgi:hypothetical protein